MHSVTNSAFRKKARQSGADLVYSEMIASEAIIRNVPKALKMASFGPKERPIVIQIFGSNAKNMARAARTIEQKFSPDGIDINFGCAAEKAVKQGFGAVQLKKPEAAIKIIKKVTSSLKGTPLSIKIRLVSKKVADTINFAKTAQSAGAAAIAIHGRTLNQKFKDKADWEIIYKVKKALPDLIVLGSGDIRSAEDIKSKIRNLDGVLVARAARNNPTVFKNLKNFNLSLL